MCGRYVPLRACAHVRMSPRSLPPPDRPGCRVRAGPDEFGPVPNRRQFRMSALITVSLAACPRTRGKLFVYGAGGERRDRNHDFRRAYNGTCVIRDIDVERSVHHLGRVIRGRVFHHRDIVAEFGGKTNGGFDTGVRDEFDHNQSVDAALLELQIKVGVGKSAGAPVLLHDRFAGFRSELGSKLATPGAVLKRLSRPCRLLNGRDVFPRFVIARTVSTMHCKENRQLRLPRGIQNPQHVGNAVVCFSDGLDAGPNLAAL